MSDERKMKWAPGWIGVLWRAAFRAALFFIFMACVMLVCYRWTRPAARPASEIFRGVTYECRDLDPSIGSGKAHLIRVDLKEPGIELYLTPVDAGAKSAGKEYVTRWAPRVAREEGLAFAVNAVLFDASMKNVLPGSHATSIESMMVDRKINHEYPHQFILWFEDDLSPHLEQNKLMGAEIAAKAKWGLGSQMIMYFHGAANPWGESKRDRQTLVGIDAAEKKLYFGIFEDATGLKATEILAAFGAKEIIRLDCGSSTSLTFGPGAKGVSSGAVVYPLRSLPVYFGVRATKL